TFARALGLEQVWELELAAMLSQIGRVTVPMAIQQKLNAGLGLSGPEKDVLMRIPEIGARLLANVPRLESVSRIVLYQEKRYDGSGFPVDAVAGEDIPMGARILKVLNDLRGLEAGGKPRFKALEELRSRRGWYDPRVIETAFGCFDLDLS